MNLLAIDTSSNACSVALLMGEKVKSIHEIAPMQQAQKILPMIESLLSENFITLNQLDALAFGCGPGSFTGVRIATSVMQGLGYATGLPLIPISSLAGLAQAAYEDLGWKELLVAIDARIQEIYWAAYRVNIKGFVELVGKEAVCKPENLPYASLDQSWYGVGNAWEVYRAQIRFKPELIDTSRIPIARSILTLAKLKYENKESVDLKKALPTYLRDDVAKKI